MYVVREARHTVTGSKKTTGSSVPLPYTSSVFTLIDFQLCFADYFTPRQTGASSMISFAAEETHDIYIVQ